MRLFRKPTLLLCVLAFLISLTVPAFAEETQTPRQLLQQMLRYYQYHQTAAKTDIYRLLSQMEELDPGQAALWRNIFEYWFYATDDMPRNETELPDDLPQDDSLCIVVLGYRLGTYGNMDPELIGRLELALKAAEQYPNALVVCTGGGTASKNADITEASQMASWLQEQGLDESRIIQESSSTHTVQNALFTFDILCARYPQVKKMVIVTSDYHLPRSSTLFHAKAQLVAAENGTEAVEIAAVLGYDANHDGIAEDPLDQTAHLARVSGFEYERGEEPPLSRLKGIIVTGDILLEPGIAPTLTVTAFYSSGFSRDVTALCDISPFDPDKEQSQTLTVTYAENGVQIMATHKIHRPVPETLPTETPLTEPETVPPTEALPVQEHPAGFSIPWLVFVIPIGFILVLIAFKKRT